MRKPYISLVVLAAFLLTIPTIHSFAEIKTYTHTVKQPFGGSQAPDDARVAAIAKAKREVLEKAGTYLESLTIIKNNMVEKDKIIALAAGVLKVEIISQENYSTKDSFGIIIDVRIKIETSILEKRIKNLLKNEELLIKYQESQKRLKEVLAKNEELEKQNQEYKSSLTNKIERDKLKKEFKKITNEFMAVEYYTKALALWVWETRKYSDSDKAFGYLNKAIELDPKYSDAYASRGIAWLYNKGISKRAISDCNKAIELDPKNAKAYLARAAVSYRIIKYSNAIADCNKAIEIDPKYSTPYLMRGYAWQKKANKKKAVDDFNHYLKLVGDKYGRSKEVRNAIREMGYKPKY